MSRFALHRQGRNCQVCPRWHARACRGLTLVGPKRAGLGHRRAGLKARPSTDRRMGLLPARSDRVSNPGEIR
jgi:ribosomal protein L15E